MSSVGLRCLWQNADAILVVEDGLTLSVTFGAVAGSGGKPPVVASHTIWGYYLAEGTLAGRKGLTTTKLRYLTFSLTASSCTVKHKV